MQRLDAALGAWRVRASRAAPHQKFVPRKRALSKRRTYVEQMVEKDKVTEAVMMAATAVGAMAGCPAAPSASEGSRVGRAPRAPRPSGTPSW